MIARMHGLGVSASVAEVAYRTVDHCSLQLLVDRAQLEGLDPGAIEAAIRELIARGEPIAPSPLNGDPTLRLRPGARLAEACEAELRRDSYGYTIFAPHLPANSPGLDGPFLVVRDLGDRNAALLSLYPDRSAYLYRDGGFVRLR